MFTCPLAVSWWAADKVNQTVLLQGNKKARDTNVYNFEFDKRYGGNQKCSRSAVVLSLRIHQKRFDVIGFDRPMSQITRVSFSEGTSQWNKTWLLCEK